MNKVQRIILFLITLGLLLVVFRIATGNWTPTSDTFIVIFSALVMLSFVTLFLEHFYTKPTDVLASTISILLLLSPLRGQLSKLGFWYEIFYVYNIFLLLAALVALLLVDDQKSSTSLQNTVSLHLKRFAVFFGNGRWLYFCLFILTLLFYVNSETKPFLWLFFYAAAIMLIDPKKYVLQSIIRGQKHDTDIGDIFGVQSKNTFLAKLYKERIPVKRFDFVQFRHAVSGQINTGLIIDNYILNQEQWVKILCSPAIRESLTTPTLKGILKNNVVYKIQTDPNNNFLKRFVGIIVENSTIEKIRFEYTSRIPISEGNLLAVQISGIKVLYQIVQGLTNTEPLESKNETGFVIGEAVQMGVWDPHRRTFEKYGWVPDVNTPVLLAPKVDIYEPKEGEQQIGVIPNTNYPILMNVAEAINHHIAILGITGSGKSVFARDLMRKTIEEDVKIVCVDFTNEYKAKFQDLQSIISDVAEADEAESQADRIFKNIDWISAELEKFPNQQCKTGIKEKQEAIQKEFFKSIETFLKSGSEKYSLFELPDVSNTTGILEYTRWFFKVLFEIAKAHNNFGKRVCVVIEEAHTVVPEWSFIGERDKHAGSLVNCISQITLQGRKYNVGFIVIAQRTANVSKTVLTQCNSIIAFQQFDKTSTEFLANYMGTEMAAALPRLKFRQAIAVGKGFRTGIPMIFEVPEIEEPLSQDGEHTGEEETPTAPTELQ